MDLVQRLEGSELVDGDHGGHWIADEADAVDGERVFVLADRQNAVRNRKVFSGQDEQHAGTRERTAGVDGHDARVRNGRAKELAVHHARQHDVVREARLAGDLRASVDAAAGRADDALVDARHCFSPPD